MYSLTYVNSISYILLSTFSITEGPYMFPNERIPGIGSRIQYGEKVFHVLGYDYSGPKRTDWVLWVSRDGNCMNAFWVEFFLIKIVG